MQMEKHVQIYLASRTRSYVVVKTAYLSYDLVSLRILANERRSSLSSSTGEVGHDVARGMHFHVSSGIVETQTTSVVRIVRWKAFPACSKFEFT